MSKTLLFAAVTVLMFGNTGCALWPPGEDLVRRVPVLEIGSPKPEGHEYILHIPAGQSVPVHMTLGGTFLDQTGKAETTITLRHDLYLYKQWSSLDGKTWRQSHDRFEVLLSAGLGTEGGTLDLKVNGPR